MRQACGSVFDAAGVCIVLSDSVVVEVEMHCSWAACAYQAVVRDVIVCVRVCACLDPILTHNILLT